MNFGREMSLLRLRFKEAGSPTLAARREAELCGSATTLGASDKEITAAADELVATYPTMGRAQMTAFVRTLWQSNVHELQAVGAHILAERAALLEPHDLAFVEGLLKKCGAEPVAKELAGDVLGVLLARNKKLWKDLRRLAGHADPRLRRAAVRACRAPLLADEDLFDRFAELAEPLFDAGDDEVVAALDEVLAAVAAVHADAAREFAARHGRKLAAPTKKKKVKAAAKKAKADEPTPTPTRKKPPAKKKAPAKKKSD